MKFFLKSSILILFIFLFTNFSHAQVDSIPNSQMQVTQYEFDEIKDQLTWWDRKTKKHIYAQLQENNDGTGDLLGLVKWKDKLIAYQCYALCQRLKVFIINEDGTIQNSFEIDKEDRIVGSVLGNNTQPIVVDNEGYIYLAYNQVRDDNTKEYIFRTVHFQKYNQQGKLLFTQHSLKDSSAVRDLIAIPSGCVSVMYPHKSTKSQVQVFGLSAKPRESYKILKKNNPNNPMNSLIRKEEESDNILTRNLHVQGDNIYYIASKNPLFGKTAKPSLIKYDLNDGKETTYFLDKKTKYFHSIVDNNGNLIVEMASVEKKRKDGKRRKRKYFTGSLNVFSSEGEQISEHISYKDAERWYEVKTPILAKDNLLLRWSAAANKLYLTDYANEVSYDEKHIKISQKIKDDLAIIQHHEKGTLFRISQNLFLDIEIYTPE